MRDKFTDRCRKAMALANQEAIDRKHGYVGTERLLLGFLHQPDCIAAKALTNLNLSLDQALDGIDKALRDRQRTIAAILYRDSPPGDRRSHAFPF